MRRHRRVHYCPSLLLLLQLLLMYNITSELLTATSVLHFVQVVVLSDTYDCHYIDYSSRGNNAGDGSPTLLLPPRRSALPLSSVRGRLQSPLQAF